jgi:hypothetical protein
VIRQHAVNGIVIYEVMTRPRIIRRAMYGMVIEFFGV